MQDERDRQTLTESPANKTMSKTNLERGTVGQFPEVVLHAGEISGSGSLGLFSVDRTGLLIMMS